MPAREYDRRVNKRVNRNQSVCNQSIIPSFNASRHYNIEAIIHYIMTIFGIEDIDYSMEILRNDEKRSKKGKKLNNLSCSRDSHSQYI